MVRIAATGRSCPFTANRRPSRACVPADGPSCAAVCIGIPAPARRSSQAWGARRSAASRQTVPAARASAMPPMPGVALMPSILSTGTPGRGRPPGLRARNEPCAQSNAQAGRAGDQGADAIAGAARRCAEDRKRSGGSLFRQPDAVREAAGPAAHGAGFRPPGRRDPGPAWPGPTATRRAAFPSRRPQDTSVRGQGRPGNQPICATWPSGFDAGAGSPRSATPAL